MAMATAIPAAVRMPMGTGPPIYRHRLRPGLRRRGARGAVLLRRLRLPVLWLWLRLFLRRSVCLWVRARLWVRGGLCLRARSVLLRRVAPPSLLASLVTAHSRTLRKPAVGNDGRLIFLLRTLDRSCPIGRGTGP